MSIPMLFITGTSTGGKTTMATRLLREGAGDLKFLRPVTATDRAPRHRPGCGTDGRPCDQLAHFAGVDAAEIMKKEPRCELNTIDYHFMTRDQFARLANPDYLGDDLIRLLNSGLSKGEILARTGTTGLIEFALVYDQLKGVPRTSLETVRKAGKIPMLVLDLQGVEYLRTVEQDAVSVCMVPPSLDAVRERLLVRDPDISEEERERRVADAAKEIEYVLRTDGFDHVIVSHENEEEETFRTLQSAILQSAERRSRPPRRALSAV